MQVAAFAVGGVNTAVVHGGQDHIASHQELGCLGAGFPPLDVGLEGGQFLEGALCTVFGGQNLVDIRRLHTIGQQGELEVVAGAFAHAAFARDLVGVKEVCPAGRGFFELVAVVGHHGGPHKHTHTTLAHSGGQQVSFGGNLAVVQLFKQAFVAAAGYVRRFDFHQVPGDVLGFHHGLDLGLLAVVFHCGDLDAFFGNGLVVRDFLGVRIGTTEVHHGNGVLGVDIHRKAGSNRCSSDQAFFHGEISLRVEEGTGENFRARKCA